MRPPWCALAMTRVQQAALHKCVASEAWGRAVAAARPFASAAQLQDVAARVWWSLGEAAWKDGFAGHGRLGKPVAEQKEAVGAADGSVLAQLREANAQYLDKFGYQCIVYAAGKPMPLVLAVVRARLANDVASEVSAGRLPSARRVARAAHTGTPSCASRRSRRTSSRPCACRSSWSPRGGSRRRRSPATSAARSRPTSWTPQWARRRRACACG